MRIFLIFSFALSSSFVFAEGSCAKFYNSIIQEAKEASLSSESDFFITARDLLRSSGREISICTVEINSLLNTRNEMRKSAIIREAQKAELWSKYEFSEGEEKEALELEIQEISKCLDGIILDVAFRVGHLMSINGGVSANKLDELSFRPLEDDGLTGKYYDAKGENCLGVERSIKFN